MINDFFSTFKTLATVSESHQTYTVFWTNVEKKKSSIKFIITSHQHIFNSYTSVCKRGNKINKIQSSLLNTER